MGLDRGVRPRDAELGKIQLGTRDLEIGPRLGEAQRGEGQQFGQQTEQADFPEGFAHQGGVARAVVAVGVIVLALSRSGEIEPDAGLVLVGFARNRGRQTLPLREKRLQGAFRLPQVCVLQGEIKTEPAPGLAAPDTGPAAGDPARETHRDGIKRDLVVVDHGVEGQVGKREIVEREGAGRLGRDLRDLVQAVGRGRPVEMCEELDRGRMGEPVGREDVRHDRPEDPPGDIELEGGIEIQVQADQVEVGQLDLADERPPGRTGADGGKHLEAVIKIGPDEQERPRVVEFHPVNHGGGAVRIDEDRVAAAAVPVALHIHAGVGWHDRKLIVLEKSGPPLPQPGRNGERPQAALEEETVFRGGEIIEEAAAGEVFPELGERVMRDEVPAVERELGVAGVDRHMVGVDALHRQLAGDALEGPAGIEGHVRAQPHRRPQPDERPEIVVNRVANRPEQSRCEHAIEPERGGFLPEVGAAPDDEETAGAFREHLAGDAGQRAGLEPGGEGREIEPLGGQAGGAHEHLAGLVGVTGRLERAAQPGVHGMQGQPAGQLQVVHRQVKRRHDRRLALQGEPGREPEPGGLQGEGSFQLQAAGEHGDVGEGPARFRRGEFDAELGLVQRGELRGQADELAAKVGIVAGEEVGDRQRLNLGPGRRGGQVHGAMDRHGEARHGRGQVFDDQFIFPRPERAVEIADDGLGLAGGRQHGGHREAGVGQVHAARLKPAGEQRPRIDFHIGGTRGDDRFAESREQDPHVIDQDAARGVKMGVTELHRHMGDGETRLELAQHEGGNRQLMRGGDPEFEREQDAEPEPQGPADEAEHAPATKARPRSAKLQPGIHRAGAGIISWSRGGGPGRDRGAPR